MDQYQRRQGSDWRWRCNVSCVLLYLLYVSPLVSSSPESSGCRQPCDNVDCGTPVQDCRFGTFLFCDNCCTACYMGPGDWCTDVDPSHDVGLCADGLICEGELPGIVYGVCADPPTDPPHILPNGTTNTSDSHNLTSNYNSSSPTHTPAPPSPSPTTPSPPPPSPSPNLTYISTTALLFLMETPEPPTPVSSGDEMLQCRPACSLDYCSERQTKKKRICSAAGLSTVVPERNNCQHTTCAACFLLREPNCGNFTCPEPPMKDCLRRFYTCLRDHYFGPTSTSNLIRLEDPEARNTPGRIICLVPELQ